MLRNPRGGMSLRWLRALLDHGIDGARPGRGVPRRQRRRACSTTRWPACSTSTPSSSPWPSCPLGISPVQHRAGDAPAHHGRGGRGGRRRRGLAGRVPSTLGRRMVFAADEYYLMAGRPFPAAEALRGLRDARGRHRHGPHVRAGVHRRHGRRPPARSAASSPPSTACSPADRCRRTRPPTPACARPWPPRRVRLPPRRGGADRSPHRRVRRPGARPAGRRRSVATTCASSPSPTSSSAATRRDRIDGRRRPRRGCWPPSRPATATCCPTCACPTTALPRRHHRRRAAPPGRGRRHRRHRPAPRPGAAPMTATDPGRAADRRHRRPAQRRQEHAVQPHRRRAGGDRRGPPRRHPRPQGDRGRVARRAVPASIDTGGWMPGGSDLDDEGQPPGRGGGARGRRRAVRRRRGRRRDRRRRGDRQLAAPGRARRCSSSPTRPTTTGARTTAGSSWRSGSASRTRSARCTAAAPATCSTRSIARLPGDAPPSRTATVAERRRGRDAVGPDGVAPATRRHRRPPERRQEHAVQPARRRGPLGRARHRRHDPRRDRHARRDRGRADRVRRHRRHARASRKIDDSAEYYSLVRALRAIDDADIALLVIDATEGVTGQDQRLAERVDAAGCPIVVMLNKWELIDDPERRSGPARRAEAQAGVRRRRAGAEDLGADRQGRAQAAPGAAGGDHAVPPPGADARRQPGDPDAQQRQPAAGGAKVLYAVQGATDPPTFTLFVNRELPPTYLRYLERRIREAFEFGSTPLKLRVRRSDR